MAKKIDGELFFVEKELNKININDLELANAGLQMKLEKSLLNELKLKQQLMQQEVEKQQQQINTADKARASKSAQRTSFIKLLEKKHSLQAGWGYDPTSGKIILGES